MLYKGTILCGLLLMLFACGYAQLSLPGIFSDNMMLQQKMNAPVWGKAGKGQKVVVKFAGKRYVV
ncbi:MAG: hypothetical protein ACK4S0_05395, partial [Sediminibacterium sp.]